MGWTITATDRSMKTSRDSVTPDPPIPMDEVSAKEGNRYAQTVNGESAFNKHSLLRKKSVITS